MLNKCHGDHSGIFCNVYVKGHWNTQINTYDLDFSFMCTKDDNLIAPKVSLKQRNKTFGQHDICAYGMNTALSGSGSLSLLVMKGH